MPQIAPVTDLTVTLISPDSSLHPEMLMFIDKLSTFNQIFIFRDGVSTTNISHKSLHNQCIYRGQDKLLENIGYRV